MARINSKLVAIKALLTALATGSYSAIQLQELTGLRRLTIYEYIRILHRKPENLIYISRWTKGTTRGHCTAHYSLGYRKEDEPRPPKQDKVLKNKRARARSAAYRERMRNASQSSSCNLSC